MKAAAHSVPGDPARRRHRLDFVTLAGLVAAQDFTQEKLTAKDRSRLRAMIVAVRADEAVLVEAPGATAWLDRLAWAPAPSSLVG